MKLFDTHTHLENEKYDSDRQDIISALSKDNIDKIVNIGTNIATSIESIKLASSNENIYASIGIHPHDAKDFTPSSIDELKELAKHKKVVAIGEIGLDYHYDFSPRDMQMNAFIAQMELAKKIDLPVIYHIREAYGDFLPMVRSNEVVNNAVMHCYGGSLESVKICINAGMMISFTGVITFKNANKIRQVVEYVPIDRLMIETDCPYMSPEPYRGKRNQPAYVLEVAKQVALIKKMSLEQVVDITYNNAINFFKIGLL